MKFSELFEDVQVRWDSEKIRKNSHDDYGLGPQYLFCCGSHMTNAKGQTEWRTAWVKLVPELASRLDRELLDGPSSVQLFYAGSPKPHVYAVAHQKWAMSTRSVAHEVTEVPDEVRKLLRWQG